VEKILVDTAVWLALLNRNDELHEQARQVMKTLRQQRTALITTEFALLEVADVLSAPAHRGRVVEFLNGLRELRLLFILPASQELWAAGWKLYCDRLDKDWSLTDCSSFAVMAQERLTQSFTSDHNFEQAGFVKLL